MRIAVLTILTGVVLASANPIMVTYLSEVCAAEENGFVELEKVLRQELCMS